MTTPTPADQLRAAAEKLRAAAGNATEGPWAIWRDLDHQGYITVGDAAGVITPPALESSGACNPVAHVYVEEDAEHIVLMHPGVGLTLAAWLGSAAERLGDTEASLTALLDPSALAVARQLLGTTEGEGAPAGEREPIQLRWGLDDVMYGDDDTTTVMLSGPGGESYWVELGPERTAALRDALAGPAAPPAPADRAAVLREAEAKAREIVAKLWGDGTTQTQLDRAGGARAVEWEIGAMAHQLTEDDRPGEAPASTSLAARVEALATEWEQRGEYGDSSISDRARELRAVLADDADHAALEKFRALATPPAAPAAPRIRCAHTDVVYGQCIRYLDDHDGDCQHEQQPAAPAAPEEPTR